MFQIPIRYQTVIQNTNTSSHVAEGQNMEKVCLTITSEDLIKVSVTYVSLALNTKSVIIKHEKVMQTSTVHWVR